jgi:hypothetical protein
MTEQTTTASQNDLNTQIILVVGNSRSGTTMMGRIFGKHPSVFTFNEDHFFEELWNPEENPQPLNTTEATKLVARLFSIQRDGYFYQGDIRKYVDEAKGVIGNLSGPATPPKIFEAFLKYEAGRNGKTVACLQTPRNVYYVKEILALYPKTYVVNMIRDPRDVLLSQKRRWMGRFSGHRKIPLNHIIRTWADYHPITISLLWRSGIRAGDQFANSPRVFQVRFENLVDSPEEMVQKICAFCGLKFQPEMLKVPQVGSSNRTDKPNQMGIDSSVPGRWKRGGLNATEIYISQKMTRQGMMQHGYIVKPVWPNPVTLLLSGIAWAGKSVLVLLLNKHRVKNLVPAIKKRLKK